MGFIIPYTEVLNDFLAAYFNRFSLVGFHRIFARQAQLSATPVILANICWPNWLCSFLYLGVCPQKIIESFVSEMAVFGWKAQ